VDYELITDKEKAVRLCFKGMRNHLLLLVSGQNGQFVHVLPSVRAFWHAEWEVEFELGD